MYAHDLLSLRSWQLINQSNKFPAFYAIRRSADGSVGIVAKLQARWSGVWVPAGASVFSSKTVQIGSEVYFPPSQSSLIFNGYQCSLPELKRPGRDVDHLPLSGAELYFCSFYMLSWRGGTERERERERQCFNLVQSQHSLHWLHVQRAATGSCSDKLILLTPPSCIYLVLPIVVVIMFTRRFKNKSAPGCPHSVFKCSCDSYNKHSLFSYTSFTAWSF
jgi:hypothetical protein